jgi:hypothetical protein
MTRTELRQIESRLGVTLPQRYRRLQLEHADRLKKLGWSRKSLVPLYVTAAQVIRPNLAEREPGADNARAFPNWWKKFVMIGTNGGGDFYCVRLSNADGIWLIGSDCDDPPARVAATLDAFVEETIANREAERSHRIEQRRRRAASRPEMDAHLAAMKRDRSAHLERAWWLTSDAIYPMINELDELKPRVSPRKLRLFGLALCRLIPNLEDDEVLAAGIALAREMTLGRASPRQVAAMRTRVRRLLAEIQSNLESFDPDTYRATLWRANAVYSLFEDDEAYLAGADHYPGDPDLTKVYEAVGYVLAGYPYGAVGAPDLLREVLGNPFHPAPVIRPWRTPAVVNLARSLFDTERFDRLPELAEALAAAGCKDRRILAHCQRPGGHVRGCWVIDEILQLDRRRR